MALMQVSARVTLLLTLSDDKNAILLPINVLLLALGAGAFRHDHSLWLPRILSL
jgi:hypothetical protein